MMQAPLFATDVTAPEDCEFNAEAEIPRIGVPRMLKPNRNQVEFRAVAPNDLLPGEHQARSVVAFVERLDLSPLYAGIQAMEGQPGRPAIDPAVLMALWVYATIEGIASARRIARYTCEHIAYQWICGGVEVSYRSLSGFRVGNVAAFQELLTDSVTALVAAGLVDMKRVAQDGMKVRASAGAASFRRRATLEDCLAEAQTQVGVLLRQAEIIDDAEARAWAAQLRAAKERESRVEEALRQLPEIEALKERNRKKNENGDSKKTEARASTTDPDARVMKMPDGGFRPAYNIQLATDTVSQVVVGVSVSNAGTDHGQMSAMTRQIKDRHDGTPSEYLVDGGFADLQEIERADAAGIKVYAPVQKPRDTTRDPFVPRRSDSPAVSEWRSRMGTPEAKEIYKDRAATAECVNADGRKDGLTQLLVRGIQNALAVGLLFGITHNIQRAISLGSG